jgi:hypothetical protein
LYNTVEQWSLPPVILFTHANSQQMLVCQTRFLVCLDDMLTSLCIS